MRKINSINRVDILEINSEKIKTDPKKELTVKNHWNWGDLVILEFNNLAITVNVDSLRRAIQNAVNAHI